MFVKTLILLTLVLSALICDVNLKSLDVRQKNTSEYVEPHDGEDLGETGHGNSQPRKLGEAEDTSEYWQEIARTVVNFRSTREYNTKKAKNIILFIGDGMSLPTLAAARTLLGDESDSLSFEKFPDLGTIKTYCLDAQVPDSACTATAYLCGIKGNYGTAGVNGKVGYKDCDAQKDSTNHVKSIAQWAMDAGKAAGLVTNTRVTHASPSGVYAHIASRYWENNAEIIQKCGADHGIDDIAIQLVHGDGKGLNVIMGGGRQQLINEHMFDEENKPGLRTDGRNLINEWQDGKTKAKYIWNREQLLDINPDDTDFLLGLFDNEHMPYHLQTKEENLEHLKPTLAEMTEKAIDILSKNEEGFFLFVEGGQIDFAHHDNYARAALDETLEFSKAIDMARQKLSDEDTLIVVSSDHSHTMHYSGYANRGGDIFGLGGNGVDKLPYMTLSYGNGLGYNDHIKDGKRVDISKLDTSHYMFRYPVTLPVESETHGGDDVGVFASGPWSHLFQGTFEQHAIPHIMAYAACIGDGVVLDECKTT